MIDVVVNDDIGFGVATKVWIDIVRQICHDHGVNRGDVSLAVVDDHTIHGLNREHLQHDYATDVLSFLLERDGEFMEGEVIVSADTANRVAEECTWSGQDELLLYVVHGTLHLVGYDDCDDEARTAMRGRETHYLRTAGVEAPDKLTLRDLKTHPRKETLA